MNSGSENAAGLQRVVLVEDDAAHVEAILRAFAGATMPSIVVSVGTLAEFRGLLADTPPTIVFMDLNLPDGSAQDYFSKEAGGGAFPVVVMTSYGDERTAVRLIRSGAMDYFTKSPEAFAATPKIAERALREWGLVQDRRRAEAASQAESAMRQALLENLPHVAVVMRMGTRDIVYSNGAARAVGAVPGQHCHTPITGVEEPCSFCRAPELWSKGVAQELEIELGGVHYEARWIPLNDELYVHYLMDITHHKQTETALRESEERFALAMDATRDGLWDWDVTTGAAHYSPGYYAQLGYLPDEFPADMKFWTDLIHPEDREQTLIAYVACLQGPSDYYEAEFRMRAKDGSWRWILGRGKAVLRDSQGVAERMLGTHKDISTQKQAEAALKSSQDELKRYLEVVESMILVLDRRGQVTLINRKGCEILGYSAREIIGKPWIDRFVPERLQRDLRERFRRIMRGEAGVTAYFESAVCPRRGEERLLAWHNSLVQDDSGVVSGIISSCEDITERRRMEKTLQEREAHFRGYFEMGLVGMAILSYDLKWLQCNDRLCEIAGYTWMELCRETWSDLVHPEELENDLVQFRRMLDGETTSYAAEKRLRRKDGGLVYADVAVRCVRRADDVVDYFLVMVHDITARKQAEEEARLRQEQLMRADKMVSLGTLVSGVAHEINNPNTFVAVNSEILHTVWTGIRPILEWYYRENGDFVVAGWNYPELQERVVSSISGIQDGAMRIKTIVEELRNFVKTETSGQSATFDVNESVHASVNLMRNMLNKSTARFEVDLGAGLPCLSGNRQPLEQVIINLLQNACQALTDREQGLSIRTALDEVRHVVLITVRDEGMGVSKDILQRLTDPFFTTKGASGGMGLGLAISLKIVEDYGGRLWFESELGQGMTAYVELPVAPVGVV